MDGFTPKGAAPALGPFKSALGNAFQVGCRDSACLGATAEIYFNRNVNPGINRMLPAEAQTCVSNSRIQPL